MKTPTHRRLGTLATALFLLLLPTTATAAQADAATYSERDRADASVRIEVNGDSTRVGS